jgi:hypothetical protein
VSNKLFSKQLIHREAERKHGEFQKKKLVQSNTSVEKVGCAQLESGQLGWGPRDLGEGTQPDSPNARKV